MQKVFKDDELSTVNTCLSQFDFMADFRHRFPIIIVTDIYWSINLIHRIFLFSSFSCLCSGKVNHAPQEHGWLYCYTTGVLISLFQALSPWASAMPDPRLSMQPQSSPPIGWYQIILLGDRGTYVLTTCSELHSTAGQLGFEPATCWLQVRQPTTTPPSHTIMYFMWSEVIGLILRRWVQIVPFWCQLIQVDLD